MTSRARVLLAVSLPMRPLHLLSELNEYFQKLLVLHMLVDIYSVRFMQNHVGCTSGQDMRHAREMP